MSRSARPAAARSQIDLDDVLDGVGDLRERHGRAEQRAELGVFVGRAAERDLVEFLALLIDAEDADVADVMVAAGVDAAGDLDVQLAEIAARGRGRESGASMSWAIGIARALARLQ